MNVFKLSKRICKDISSMMAKFWWTHHHKEKGIHWKKWESLRSSKSYGGLGFKNIEVFNNTMLAKQWRVLKNGDSLATQILKSKYFKNTSVLDAKVGYRPSFL